MLLSIIRPSSKKIFEIKWLDVQTYSGNFVIKDEHAPTILTLSENSIVLYLENNKQETSSFVAKHGIVHVTRTSITILTNDL